MFEHLATTTADFFHHRTLMGILDVDGQAQRLAFHAVDLLQHDARAATASS
jgi:hypothetical protein